MVQGEWDLRWCLFWPEVDGPKDPKPFLGIGPDCMSMARGAEMPWPYNADGTINQKYIEESEVVEDCIRDSAPRLHFSPITVPREELMRGAPMALEALGRLLQERMDRQLLEAVTQDKVGT